MMATKSFVDEFIDERRIEELRESISDAFRDLIERPINGKMFEGKSPYAFLEGGSPDRFYLVRQNVAGKTV